MNTASQTNCGESGIWAWDLQRLIFFCGLGYLCDYISYEDALDWCLKTGQKLQTLYQSWDAFMGSYLLGPAPRKPTAGLFGKFGLFRRCRPSEYNKDSFLLHSKFGGKPHFIRGAQTGLLLHAVEEQGLAFLLQLDDEDFSRSSLRN